jgi:hypothetical protein
MNLAHIADRELTWLGDCDGRQRERVRQQLAELGEKLQADGWHSPLWDDSALTTGS